MNLTSISVASEANSRPPPPILPCFDLINGPREQYLRIGVPLYEASVNGDWKAASSIFEKYKAMELLRYSITENGDTSLHIAVSGKRSKNVKQFVKNVVNWMNKEDLTLQNKNNNTALYLAAIAGNVEAVKIMVLKNRALLTIPGGGGRMMPLYAAALFGNYDVVKYLYEYSIKLNDDGWTSQNRGWLFEKCVENDMFDIALQIVQDIPELADYAVVLGILAQKTDTFSRTKYHLMWRTINSVFSVSGLKVGPTEKNSAALQLLRILLKNIAKKPKIEIDRILRGPPELVSQDDWQASGKVVEARQLRKLISKHLQIMKNEINDIIFGSTDPVNQLENLIDEQLVYLRLETENIVRRSQDSSSQDAKPLGRPFLELQQLISKYIVKLHTGTEQITRDEDYVPNMKRVISEHIEELDIEAKKNYKFYKEPSERRLYSSRILFVAAELGNTEFVVEFIHQYPDSIWKVNDNGQSIFHIAVKHRRQGIYTLLYEIGSMKNLITPLRDQDDNNMLHLAGMCAMKNRLEDVSGAALQMQLELIWFKEVESMIPPSYRKRKNKDGLTPHELFSKEHKDLVTQGEKWMKETASQFLVVDALIATMVFTAAFTIPGGYDQNTGIPIFHKKPTFIVFVVADALSLFFSATSILTILSILTSRYAEVDFLVSLPAKLTVALSTLSVSIAAMMVAFTFSFFILYRNGMLWIAILMVVFAILPGYLYVFLQYRLLVSLIRSTYGSRNFFKPMKHVLYYQNPKI